MYDHCTLLVLWSVHMKFIRIILYIVSVMTDANSCVYNIAVCHLTQKNFLINLIFVNSTYM